MVLDVQKDHYLSGDKHRPNQSLPTSRPHPLCSKYEQQAVGGRMLTYTWIFLKWDGVGFLQQVDLGFI